MSLRSGTQKYGDVPKDEWVVITSPEGHGDFNRNLYLEKILPEKVESNKRQYDHDFKGGLNPIEWYTLPSWWGIVQTECGQHDCPYPYPHSSCERTCIGKPFTTGYQQQNYTKQEALEFCEIVIKINNAKNEWDSYRCNNYPRSPVYCTYIRDSGALVKFAEVLKNEMRDEGLNILPILEDFAGGIPYASAEEDPSIYQSDEVVTVTPGALTWYYVKKPSGVCERLNVSQNFVDRMTSQGWIFSLTDICKTGVKCPARVRIINNETNQASGDGVFNCDTIEQYTEDPRYRVEYYDGVTTTPTTTTTTIPTTTTTTTPTTVHVTPPEETRCYMVHGQKVQLTQQAVDYYRNIDVTVTPCNGITSPPPPSPPPPPPPPPEPEKLTWYYVKKPSGICERLNVSQNFVDRMTSQGWIFSLTDICVTSPPPPEPEPGEINWIPEPFFSFINNVFRR